MANSITMSKKYGVNPSMYCCFWCGEPKGIALLGKLEGDAKAPPKIISDYEPCDKCKAMFDKGVLVMGVSNVPVVEGMEPIDKNSQGEPLYPDGTYFVASDDYICHIYDDDEEARKHVLETRKLLMDSELVRKIVEYIHQEDHDDEDSGSRVSDSETSNSDETH